MLKDIHSGSSVMQLIAAAEYGADNTEVTLDLQGYDGCEIVIAVGVGGITFSATNKIEFVLTESDDDSSYSTVDAEYVHGADTVTDGIIKALTSAHGTAAVYRFGYVGYARYLQLLADFSGSHGTDTPIAAFAILRGMNNPQPDQS